MKDRTGNKGQSTQPITVRLQRMGKRFEVVCESIEGIMKWRSKEEQNLDQVLVKQTVFTNVSKAEVAKHDDLLKAFNTDDTSQICAKILAEGEIHCCEQDREKLLGFICEDIANKTLNPNTQKPYTAVEIEKMLKDSHFVLKTTKTLEQEVHDAISFLRKTIPIAQAQLRCRASFDLSKNENQQLVRKLQKILQDKCSKVEEDTKPDAHHHTITFYVVPGHLALVEELLHGKPGVVFEVVTTVRSSEDSTSPIAIASNSGGRGNRKLGQSVSPSSRSPLRSPPVKSPPARSPIKSPTSKFDLQPSTSKNGDTAAKRRNGHRRHDSSDDDEEDEQEEEEEEAEAESASDNEDDDDDDDDNSDEDGEEEDPELAALARELADSSSDMPLGGRKSNWHNGKDAGSRDRVIGKNHHSHSKEKHKNRNKGRNVF